MDMKKIILTLLAALAELLTRFFGWLDKRDAPPSSTERVADGIRRKDPVSVDAGIQSERDRLRKQLEQLKLKRAKRRGK